jgi:MATE family multidrug resistance protein
MKSRRLEGALQDPGGYAEVLKVAWPLIISMGSFTLMQFFDRVFLAWYSATAIQAALPAGILSFTLICFFMALAGYANTFVAQYHGAGDAEGCSRATAQGIWLALVSWPLMVALIPVGWWILRISHHEPEVLAAEKTYYTILMLGSVTTPLGAALSSFFTGRGDTVTNMYAHMSGNVVNLALDYAMIFGRWGFPEMGIAGAAWATVIAGFVAPAIFGVLYFRNPLRDLYRTRETLRLDLPLVRRMIKFGAPSAVHLFLDVASFALFVLMVGRLGAVALAASNIALAVNGLAFMPLLGISTAASILVGQYQGRRDAATAEKATWNSLRIGWIYMIAVGATFVLFPRAYFVFFETRGAGGLTVDQLLPVGRWLLYMMAAWGLMDTTNLVLSGALKGAGDTRFVMIYSVCVAWGVWIAGEWLIIFALKRGVLAAWLWLTFYVFILAAGYWVRFRGGRWKTIEMIEAPAGITPDRPGAEPLAIVE